MKFKYKYAEKAIKVSVGTKKDYKFIIRDLAKKRNLKRYSKYYQKRIKELNELSKKRDKASQALFEKKIKRFVGESKKGLNKEKAKKFGVGKGMGGITYSTVKRYRKIVIISRPVKDIGEWTEEDFEYYYQVLDSYNVFRNWNNLVSSEYPDWVYRIMLAMGFNNHTFNEFFNFCEWVKKNKQ